LQKDVHGRKTLAREGKETIRCNRRKEPTRKSQKNGTIPPSRRKEPATGAMAKKGGRGVDFRRDNYLSGWKNPFSLIVKAISYHGRGSYIR